MWDEAETVRCICKCIWRWLENLPKGVEA